MAAIIEEASTLGVDYGGKIVYRVENGRVTVHNPQAEHHDPALGSFLQMLEKDIAAGRSMRDLPVGLLSAMRRAAKEVHVDLDEELEGEVVL